MPSCVGASECCTFLDADRSQSSIRRPSENTVSCSCASYDRCDSGARSPLAKGVDDFACKDTRINEALARGLASGSFIVQQRNVVFVGGTGTGKTYLAIAVARSCIRAGSRGRFFTTIDLVNRLGAEARTGRQGRLADYLTRLDFVVLDELDYLPLLRRAVSSCSI